MRKHNVLKFFIIALLALLFLYVAFSGDLQNYISQKNILAQLEKMGRLAPLGYMAVMAVTVTTPLPTLPLNFAAGIFFGPYWGTLYSAAGALGGSIISYTVARLLGRSLIERFLRGHINFCTACSDRMLTGIVFLARLVPLVSFDMISYGAGLTKMSLSRYCIATFLGMLPLTFVYNYFGSALAVDGRVAIVLGIVMVGMLFLLPVWFERYAPEKIRAMFRHQ